MKRKSEFYPNSNIIPTKNRDSQSQAKKSRNIPAEIWLKRNVLKKLTLQLKFNKNSTNEYRKFREILTDPEPSHQIHGNSLPINESKQNVSQILTPSKQREMRKLSSAKAGNLTKYTQNFFASNAFSKNGLKSYHYKSSACQGNNFINVSKAVILEKKNQEKKKDVTPYHKRSFSQITISNQDTEKVNIPPKRSFSAHRPTKSQDFQKTADFLKVTTKELHFSNIDAFLMDCTRQSRHIFSRRSKTEPKNMQKIQSPKQRIEEKKEVREAKPKLPTNIRPKSCMVKANRNYEFNNCEGWVTATGKYQRDEDEPFSNFLYF